MVKIKSGVRCVTSGCRIVNFINDDDRVPLRQRIFFKQLAESPETADKSLLDDLPEHHRLWALIRLAVINENLDDLRYYYKRFLVTRARRHSGRLKAICAATDLFLISGKLNDFAEARQIIFELVPDRIERDEDVCETITTVAIASGIAGDHQGVEEIEPWIYSLGVNPYVAVLSNLLLERPNKEINSLFDQIIEEEKDKYRKTKLTHISKRTAVNSYSRYTWGSLFRPKKDGWYKTIVKDDDFAFYKPSRLTKLQIHENTTYTL